MRQDTRRDSYQMASQTAPARVLQIKDRCQRAEDRLYSMAQPPQRPLHPRWPLGFLVVLAQRQQQDPLLAPQTLFQADIIVDLVANQGQVAALFDQCLQRLRVWHRRRREHPIINQLIASHRGMHAPAKELAFFARHHAKIGFADYRMADIAARVGHQGDRRAIHQPNRVSAVQNLVAQITADRFNQAEQIAATRVEPIEIEQLGETACADTGAQRRSRPLHGLERRFQ